jgi:hypothetical protein
MALHVARQQASGHAGLQAYTFRPSDRTTRPNGQHSSRSHRPDDGGSKHLRNVRQYLPDYTTVVAVRTWNLTGQQSCFVFRRSRVQISTRRPAIQTMVCRCFSQSLQANVERIPWSRPRPLPSISFRIHYSVIIPTFDAKHSYELCELMSLSGYNFFLQRLLWLPLRPNFHPVQSELLTASLNKQKINKVMRSYTQH